MSSITVSKIEKVDVIALVPQVSGYSWRFMSTTISLIIALTLLPGAIAYASERPHDKKVSSLRLDYTGSFKFTSRSLKRTKASADKTLPRNPRGLQSTLVSEKKVPAVKRAQHSRISYPDLMQDTPVVANPPQKHLSPTRVLSYRTSTAIAAWSQRDYGNASTKVLEKKNRHISGRDASFEKNALDSGAPQDQASITADSNTPLTQTENSGKPETAAQKQPSAKISKVNPNKTETSGQPLLPHSSAEVATNDALLDTSKDTKNSAPTQHQLKLQPNLKPKSHLVETVTAALPIALPPPHPLRKTRKRRNLSARKVSVMRKRKTAVTTDDVEIINEEVRPDWAAAAFGTN